MARQARVAAFTHHMSKAVPAGTKKVYYEPEVRLRLASVRENESVAARVRARAHRAVAQLSPAPARA